MTFFCIILGKDLKGFPEGRVMVATHTFKSLSYPFKVNENQMVNSKKGLNYTKSAFQKPSKEKNYENNFTLIDIKIKR